MRARLFTRGAVAAGLILSTLHSVNAAPTIPQFTYQEVGLSQPFGLNQAGDVFGVGLTQLGSNNTDGGYWSALGGLVNIGRLPNPDANSTFPPFFNMTAMNNRGQITGYSEVKNSISHAFLWSPAADKKSGSMVDLGTLDPTVNQTSRPTALNERGQVVGLSGVPGGFGSPNVAHGFLYTSLSHDGVRGNVQMKDLGELTPSAIDSSGRVYGILNNALTIYENGTYFNLGMPAPFNPADSYIQIYGRTPSGDLYGTVGRSNPSEQRFYVWIPTPNAATGVGRFITAPMYYSSMTGAIPPSAVPRSSRLIVAGPFSDGAVYALDPYADTLTRVVLGTIYYGSGSIDTPYSGAFNSTALGANLVNDIVGYSSLPYISDTRNFFEHGGLLYDLNALTPTAAGVFSIGNPVGINTGGQVLARASHTGDSFFHSLVLSPAAAAPPRALTITSAQPQPPKEKDPDQYIGITGTGFQQGARVGFDGKAIDAKVYAESQIVAFLPSAKLTPGSHTILIINPDHTTATTTYVVKELRQYPTLTAVAPDTLPAGSPDTNVTVTGTSLYSYTQISTPGSGGQPSPLTVVSVAADHHSAVVTLPASRLISGRTFELNAANPEANDVRTSYTPPVLTVVNPVPTITSIDGPPYIADTYGSYTVTIHGTGFVPQGFDYLVGPTTMLIGPGLIGSLVYVSPTELSAQIIGDANQTNISKLPAGSYTINVTNPAPGGGTASGNVSIVNGPNLVPVVTEMYPTSLFSDTDGVLYLTGSGFENKSVVRIGTRTYKPTTESSGTDRSYITLNMSAANLQAGVYDLSVVNPAPGGGASAPQKLTVLGPSLVFQGIYLTRDPQTHFVVAHVYITNKGGTATSAFIESATLGGKNAAGLRVRLGAVRNGVITVLLNFPASSAAEGVPADLVLSGSYPGGTFSTTRSLTIGSGI